MKWVLEHLQVIIVIAGAIAYWLNQRRREKEGMPADYDGDGVPDTQPGPAKRNFDTATMEAEEAERTRRVQDEIRRKIAERRGQLAPPPVPVSEPPPMRTPPAGREMAPPPVFHDPVAEMLKEFQRRLAPETVPAPPPEQPVARGIDQAMLQRQLDLQVKMEALEAEKRAVKKRAAELSVETARQFAVDAQTPSSSGVNWMADLRDPALVRRAIVMREVLGTPVGLR